MYRKFILMPKYQKKPMSNSINCLFPRDPKQLRWGQPLLRHRFLLLQNRHTVHPVHKPHSEASDHLHLLPWMACMQALQEQKPVTKKSELIEIPIKSLDNGA